MNNNWIGKQINCYLVHIHTLNIWYYDEFLVARTQQEWVDIKFEDA